MTILDYNVEENVSQQVLNGLQVRDRGTELIRFQAFRPSTYC